MKTKSLTKSKKKPYPIIDGHRNHYVRYPLLITESEAERNPCALPLIPGQYVAVDVTENGYSHLISPGHFKRRGDCQKACDNHNKYHGWSETAVNKIIAASMFNSDIMDKVAELEKKKNQAIRNAKRQQLAVLTSRHTRKHVRVRPEFWHQAMRDYSIEIYKLKLKLKIL